MPDTFDYEWLSELLDHPEDWTAEDLSAVRFMLANQRRSLDDTHPRDLAGRRAAHALIDQIETALHAYMERRGTSDR